MKTFSFFSFRTWLQPTFHLGQACLLAGKGEQGGSEGATLSGFSVSVQRRRRRRRQCDVLSAKFSEGEENEGKSERLEEKNEAGQVAEQQRRGSECEL